MTSSLKQMLDNPFLRDSPFRANQQFYSAPKKYESDTYYKPLTKSNYNDLSADFNNHQSISISSKTQSGNQLRKKSNPFFRKNLISANKEHGDDHVQFESINMSRNDPDRIKIPNFLDQSKSSNANSINELLYRDLSHKAPPSGSKKCIILQTRPMEQIRGLQNKQNLISNAGLGSKGHLVSPRFPSVKVIGQNHNKVLVPELTNLRGSLNNIQNSDRYSLNYLGHPTLLNNSRPSSSKNLPNRLSKQIQPERDTNRSFKKPNLVIPSDGSPLQITVKGHKYFRSAVELIRV